VSSDGKSCAAIPTTTLPTSSASTIASTSTNVDKNVVIIISVIVAVVVLVAIMVAVILIFRRAHYVRTAPLQATAIAESSTPSSSLPPPVRGGSMKSAEMRTIAPSTDLPTIRYVRTEDFAEPVGELDPQEETFM